MNITDLISGGIGEKTVSSIANNLNIDQDKAKYLVAAAVPLMVSALNYNAQKDETQAESINNALQSKHNGSILDSLGDFLGQGPSDDENKIVQHMFGKNTDYVTNNLSEKTGLSSDKISAVLATLAPIVMGFLGKQKSGASGGGIGDLIGSVLGGGQGSSAGGGLLGNILGSVLGGGSSSQSGTPNMGGIGDLVGDFFNKDKKNQAGNILDSLAGMFGK